MRILCRIEKSINLTSEGDLIKKLEIKMEMLGLMENDIPKVLNRNKMEELEKTATLIENKLDELQELNRNVQEQMFVGERKVRRRSESEGI